MTRMCSVDGCDFPARTRGYCNMHYQRLYRHGSPNIVKPKGPPAVPIIVTGPKATIKLYRLHSNGRLTLTNEAGESLGYKAAPPKFAIAQARRLAGLPEEREPLYSRGGTPRDLCDLLEEYHKEDMHHE